MCGISGVIGPKINDKEAVIGKMVGKITHRGPDDDGFYVDKNIAMGMRRLAIIDLETGRQPIATDDGKLVIVFNGEIYNYKELKDELLQKGYVFKTTSDTEVILTMFQEYGEKMLPKLRGMFVFSIYNTETKEVFIARDFFGIKPLYYYIQNEQIVAYSSEVKSFEEFPGFKAEVNHAAVVNFLSFQYNPLVETLFKNVFKLPPAHYLKINVDSGEIDIKKYWNMEFHPNSSIPEEEAKKDIHETIKDSVAHHMIADVPVGAFLSGGLDSSIITTLMQEIRGDNKIKTFTVGFNTLTEGKEAEETASFLGTDHTELNIGPDEYFSVLPKVVYHFDEPIADPSAVGLYFVAEEASKHVKVVLSGEGSDELFGGYNIYFTPIESQKLSWIPKVILKAFTSLPFEFYGKNYLKRVSMKIEDWYIGQKYFNGSIFTREEIDLLWEAPAEKYMSLAPLYKHIKSLSDSTKMQYIDINTWLVGDILAKADKMTMANSLELRVPFLDKEVAKMAGKLPDRYKWNGGVSKYILREAFKNIIPESTRNRRKLGFPTPVKDWFTADRKDVYRTILENEYINSHMSIDYIKNIIEDHVHKKADNSRKIYILLVLSLWYDVFISKKIKPI
ncbi:MAG TPA: asparagine synthase (glutamine-hydrolyzing) [Parcubacteria group bacterium]|jgi:asparagine synthase (glutamine-hydrolysing)|nr:asparagine synthase (glutamine-hydrolyzing) [Parcubacteria group bacterium]